MYTSTDEREFQLELWNGKTYEPVNTGLANTIRPASYPGRAWRLVLPEKQRPAKPKYTLGRSRSRTPDHNRETVIAQYMDWAKESGLRHLTVYQYCHIALAMLPKGVTSTAVDPADFLGPAPAAKIDDGLSEAV